jgi:hypothetical protein
MKLHGRLCCSLCDLLEGERWGRAGLLGSTLNSHEKSLERWSWKMNSKQEQRKISAARGSPQRTTCRSFYSFGPLHDPSTMWRTKSSTRHTWSLTPWLTTRAWATHWTCPRRTLTVNFTSRAPHRLLPDRPGQCHYSTNKHTPRH